MARISFDTLQETVSTGTGENNNAGIKLFALKNDGDVAIVRIMHDNVQDFDILTTHKIKVGDKWRTISCIRDPREPIDNCPLCKANEKIQQRFYIHMIQYVKDDATGKITPTPVVWDRTAGEYATKFKTLIEEYGPLSNQIFKIKRNGKAGDMSTTYEILFGSPNMYPEELYPKTVEAFSNYTALGRIVLDKNYNEINTFLATGNFPQATNNTTNVAQPQQSYVGTNLDAVVDDTPVPNYNNNAYPTTATGYAVEPSINTAPNTNIGTGAQMPWQGNSTAGVNRPIRRY